MKLTKTQIILASAGAIVGGAAIFFGLTKTGKELIKKWFGKEETTEPAGDTTTDTTQTDIPQNTGIVPPLDKGKAPPPPKETSGSKPPPPRKQPMIYAKKALTPVYDLNVLTDKTLSTPVRLAGNGELLGKFIRTGKSFWGNKYLIVDAGNKVTRAVASENASLKS